MAIKTLLKQIRQTLGSQTKTTTSTAAYVSLPEKNVRTLSVAVIAWNEEKYLDRILDDIYCQDFPKENIEIVIVNSASTDATKVLMEKFAGKHQLEYMRIVVCDNPKKILPAGWNVFLGVATGDALVKVDAHARLPKDFLSKTVTVINTGEYVCGGQRPCMVEENAGDWEKTLLVVEDSLFGSSIANYRGAQTQAHYVSSLFHGGYRREVFDKVGKFNEELVRTEDNDIHYRIRQAGYRILLDPQIFSKQIVRPTLSGMVRQKYGNGYWIGRTLFVQPKAVALHHIVPSCFVSGLAISTLLALGGKPTILKMVGGSYLLVDLIMSGIAVRELTKKKYAFVLPAIFPLLHVTYGVSTISGIAKGIKNIISKRFHH